MQWGKIGKILRLVLIIKYTLKNNLMTSNKVENAEKQNRHKKNSFRGCTCIDRVLKSTNMHTKWCTDVMVTNSYLETRFTAMVHLIHTKK